MSAPASAAPNEWDTDIPADDSLQLDPLLDSLTVLTRIYGNPFTRETLRAGLPLQDGKLTVELFIRAADRAGLSSRLLQRELQKIPALVTPVVLLLQGRQTCILLSVDHEEGIAKVIQPESGEGERYIELEKLEEAYTGYCLYVRQKHLYDDRSPSKLKIKSRHWFWGTISLSWRIYRDVLIASFLINIFVVISPLFVMNVYDRVVPNNAMETLWVLSIGAFVIFTFDFILKMVRSYFIDLAGKKSDVLLSARIMERVLGLTMGSRPASVGSFSKNLQEFESIREFITSSTIVTIVDLPFVVIVLAVILIIGGPMAFVPMTGMLLIAGYGFFIQAPLRGSIEKTLRTSSQKNATLIEVLTGIQSLKIARAESDIQHKWEKMVGHLATWGVRTKLLTSSATSFSAWIQQLNTIALILIGVSLISEGELSMGALIATVMLSGRCLAPMAQVAGLSTRYQQAVSALDGLNQIMDMPVERPEGADFVQRQAFRGHIEFDSVNFAYPGQEIKAMDNVSFKVGVGEKVAIIGRIGSGKTTIEKMILGLYHPDEGAVRVDGIDLRQINPSDLRRNIGCVAQDITLFYGSAKDNISMGASYVDDAAILRAAETAGVMEFANRHPQGLDMQIAERGENLSGGQRQSIALARALLLDPPILLLDEPSSSMDNTTELRVKNQLKEKFSGKTMILVTHKASMLDLVDRLIVVNNGRVVADGPKAQVHAALKQGKLRIE